MMERQTQALPPDTGASGTHGSDPLQLPPAVDPTTKARAKNLAQTATREITDRHLRQSVRVQLYNVLVPELQALRAREARLRQWLVRLGLVSGGLALLAGGVLYRWVATLG